MAKDLDRRSRELLSEQQRPQHVEREQKYVEKTKDDEIPDELIDEDDRSLDEESPFTKITNEARKVEAFADIVEEQLEKKLANYSVRPKEVDTPLLDAEERLFGTRTGNITYPMYRVCLHIIGEQTKQFSDKVAASPESVMESVGGNLENVFTPSGAQNFMNQFLGELDYDEFKALDDVNPADIKWWKLIWEMIVRMVLPKKLKKFLES